MPDSTLPPAPKRMRLLATLGALALGGLIFLVLYLIAGSWAYRHFKLWGSVVAAVYWWSVSAFVADRYGVDIRSSSHRARRSRKAQPAEAAAGEVITVATAEAQHAQRARVLRWVFGYLLPPVAALGMLVATVDYAVPAWRVAHTAKVPGVVTLLDTCEDGYCYGDFVSDDKALVVPYVDVEGPVPNTAKDATVHVWLSPDMVQSYTRIGTSTWLVPGLVALLFAVYALAALYWLFLRIRSRLRPTSSTGVVTLP